MKTQSKKPALAKWQLLIREKEEEIKSLKKQMEKPHFIKSSEQDYDIKSHIIDKQNEIIELFIKRTKYVRK